MTTLVKFLTAAAAIGGLAVPAVAQAPYPPYPQPAPGQPGYGYYPPQQTYPYGQQGYGTDPISQAVNQLLGNRYNPADRNAITRCASAAVQQAAAQYGGQPYGNAYGYRDRGYGYPQQGYSNAANMRVTSITNVERRQYGLRVSGMIDSRGGVPPYGNAYGYPNQGYPNSGYPNSGYAAGDLSFRCNVDYQGAVTNVRVHPVNQYRGYLRNPASTKTGLIRPDASMTASSAISVRRLVTNKAAARATMIVATSIHPAHWMTAKLCQPIRAKRAT